MMNFFMDCLLFNVFNRFDCRRGPVRIGGAISSSECEGVQRGHFRTGQYIGMRRLYRRRR